MFKNRSQGIFAGAALGLVAALAAAAPAAAQAESAKIAVIDVAKLVQESAPGKAVLAELETYGNTQRSALETRNNELKSLRQQIADGQLSLSEDRLSELQTELERKTIDLQRATDDAQREFNKRQQKAFEGIEKQIMPVIREVGQAAGYTMIFNKFESGLVFASDSVDITDQVIERLADPSATGG